MFIRRTRTVAVSTTAISPSASCAPNAPARRCDNAPCSIWDDTSRSPNHDWPALCRASTNSSPARCHCLAILPRRSNRTPSTSPPSCSPASASAPSPRPRLGAAATSNTSMSMTLELPSALGRRGTPRPVGDGPTRPAHAARASRYRCVVARRRLRLDHRAHGTPGLRARHPALAGRTQRLRANCSTWTSQRWDRCGCIAPPMR